jgi:hypothetical protein
LTRLFSEAVDNELKIELEEELDAAFGEYLA